MLCLLKTQEDKAGISREVTGRLLERAARAAVVTCF